MTHGNLGDLADQPQPATAASEVIVLTPHGLAPDSHLGQLLVLPRPFWVTTSKRLVAAAKRGCSGAQRRDSTVNWGKAP
jgi:hypothetical protein